VRRFEVQFLSGALLALTAVSCAAPDLASPIQGGFGIYRQSESRLSRFETVRAFRGDIFVRDELGAYDAWNAIGMTSGVLGAATGAVALGAATGSRGSDEVARATGIASLSLLGIALVSEVIARFCLDSVVERHNRQVLGFERPEGEEDRDPAPVVGSGDVDEDAAPDLGRLPEEEKSPD
jgi:hypothetical protein